MRCFNCGYPLLHTNLPSLCTHPNVQHLNDVVRGARVIVEPSKEVAEAPAVEAPSPPPVKSDKKDETSNKAEKGGK